MWATQNPEADTSTLCFRRNDLSLRTAKFDVPSLPKMGTVAQSKEPIQVEGKSAKQERHTSHILKLRIQYRGRYPRDPEFVLPNWHRDFEIADKTTLEQLATIILQILGWSEDHLYEFKHCRYVNFACSPVSSEIGIALHA
jgi:hypothetical protein